MKGVCRFALAAMLCSVAVPAAQAQQTRELTPPQRPGRHPHSLILRDRSRLRTAKLTALSALGTRPDAFLSGFSATRSYPGAPMVTGPIHRIVEAIP